MGVTNLGQQVITFDYKQFALSKGFNQLLRDVIVRGIYKGGLLSRIADNQVAIMPGTFCFECNYGTDPVYKLLVKASSVSQVSVNVYDTAPYVTMSINWAETPDNWIDFETKTQAEIDSGLADNYIIVGKVPFSGGIIPVSPTFDYSMTDRGFIYNSDPSQKHKLISRAGIHPNVDIVDDQDVINKIYFDTELDEFLDNKPAQQIPFGDADRFYSHSADLKYDDSLKELKLNGKMKVNSTSSPVSEMDVEGDASVSGSYKWDNVDSEKIQGDGVNNNMDFYTNSKKAMRLDKNNNLIVANRIDTLFHPFLFLY